MVPLCLTLHLVSSTRKQPGTPLTVPRKPPLTLFSAYGEFEVTDDCSDLTSASFLSAIGKKTKCLLRISTVGPERGSADTVRDVHGWAMKLYTDDGNLDWVFNNTVRDPILRSRVVVDVNSPFSFSGTLSSFRL